MNFHLRPYNQYILNIVTNIYLGLDLREKIELDPKHPQYLKVVWGVGYKIEKQGRD